MKKNHLYTLTAKAYNPAYSLANYSADFTGWQNNFNFNSTHYANPKEIDSITANSDGSITIRLWTQNPLPAGRELQSVRRLSEDMAVTYPHLVTGKSHVMISA